MHYALIGPEGCGKTTKAHEIASGLGGHFTEVRWTKDESEGFGLGRLLASSPSAIIFDLPQKMKASDWEKVKALTTAKDLVCERRGQDATIVPAPTFIFCSSNRRHVEMFVGRPDFRVWAELDPIETPSK